MAQYEQKNYGKAADSFDEISGRIRKMKGDALAKFLPAAPQGWTAKEEQNPFGINIPGNGSEAERSYVSGGTEIKISISADSKLMSTIRKLKSSPAPMQFMGHDYVFKAAEPGTPDLLKRSEAILYVSDNLAITV